MKIGEFIYALITSLNYNRETDYTIEVCHRVINRLKKDYEYRIEHKYDGDGIDDDVNIIMGAIIIAYGDYGTSPRHGWIKIKPIAEEIINALVMRINELSYMHMEELLNDT